MCGSAIVVHIDSVEHGWALLWGLGNLCVLTMLVIGHGCGADEQNAQVEQDIGGTQQGSKGGESTASETGGTRTEPMTAGDAVNSGGTTLPAAG